MDGRTTLRAVGGAWAGRSTLEGHQRGAFSGGEIQRLRRLRQEAHTPTVLVAVSDSFTAALPQSAQSYAAGLSSRSAATVTSGLPFPSLPLPQSHPDCHSLPLRLKTPSFLSWERPPQAFGSAVLLLRQICEIMLLFRVHAHKLSNTRCKDCLLRDV